MKCLLNIDLLMHVSAIRCPEFEDIPQGSISATGYSYSDTAEVTCDEGYYPLLPNKTWCQTDGQWSPYGTCERKFIGRAYQEKWQSIEMKSQEIVICRPKFNYK